LKKKAVIVRKNTKIWFWPLVLFLLLVQYAFSAEPKKAPDPKPVKTPASIADFTYTSENRRDPFEPAQQLRAKRIKPADTKKKGYELEELKLVGIFKKSNNTYAMMEDMHGKGVLFKKGDFLNNNMWVADVLEGKLVLGYKLKGDVKNITVEIPRK